MSAAVSRAQARWPLGEAQRRAIWALVGRLARAPGMSRESAEDVLRGVVRDVSGQASTRALTAAQAADVLSHLEDRAAAVEPAPTARSWRPTGRTAPLIEDRKRPGPRAIRAATEDTGALVTKEQSGALLALAMALGWNQAQIRGWITTHMKKVTAGRPWPQTRGEAQACHEGLEAMLWRHAESQSARVLERATALSGLPTLTVWEESFVADVVKRKGKLRPAWKRIVKLGEIERKHQPAHGAAGGDA